MNKIFNAKINWLSKEQGGRQIIPFGDKYCPIIIIKGNKLNSHESTWSVFVGNKEHISNYETLAEVKYFSDKAPNNLSENVEFDLYEGNKIVAHGIII